MSIVPSVLLNPEDGQWEEIWEDVGDKLMKNKCYYIIIKEDVNLVVLDRGNVKFNWISAMIRNKNPPKLWNGK